MDFEKVERRQRRISKRPPRFYQSDQLIPRDHRGGRGSGFGFGIVRLASGTGTRILVTPAVEDLSAGAPQRMKALNAKTIEMLTWPGLTADDYKAFVHIGEINEDTVFLPVMLMDKKYYVWQQIPWDVQSPPPNVDFSDCTPVVRY